MSTCVVVQGVDTSCTTAPTLKMVTKKTLDAFGCQATSPRNKNAKDVVKKKANAFAALEFDSGNSDSESTDLETVSPRTALESLGEDSSNESMAEVVEEGWSAAPVRRKGGKSVARPTGASNALATPVRAVHEVDTPIVATAWVPQQQEAWQQDDDEPADAAFFMCKGQRHGWSKHQKQEWSFKSKLRLDKAKQKRDDQRNGAN
eukprot:TRINITY_DN69348_c0_g1_i1.p1 TRINITY_DN69348_c0_g1~~TRINITY_DN69348_c0_g1_i1.p1  ORF type:complete len:204 (-),score=47.96 TRINITY_DN69348_c0_g1_i1:116-727(-)